MNNIMLAILNTNSGSEHNLLILSSILLVAGSSPARPIEKDLKSGERKIYSTLQIVFAGVTQLARVPAFQADCCGFESRHPLH